jgi:hypothetical protein
MKTLPEKDSGCFVVGETRFEPASESERLKLVSESYFQVSDSMRLLAAIFTLIFIIFSYEYLPKGTIRHCLKYASWVLRPNVCIFIL